MAGLDFGNFESILEKTDYFVEADSATMHLLWVTNVDRPYPKVPPVKWEEISSNFRLDLEKTSVMCYFGLIHGNLVCFFSPCGMKTDRIEMFEYLGPYIKKDESGSLKQTNAMNFHHCVSYCKSHEK